MPSITHFHDEQQGRNAKSLHLIVAVSLILLLLLGRLAYLQIIQADTLIRLSRENSMRLKNISPPRGCIYDRNGETLARNRPSYSICVVPWQMKKKDTVIRALCRIKDSCGMPLFDGGDLDSVIKKAFARRFDATRLKEDVSLDLMSIVEEHSMELPGIIVAAEARREYPLGKKTFHVLGYMSEVPENEFDSLKQRGYNYGDLFGKAGIERSYEQAMRGTCGREYIEVDAYGKNLGPIPNVARIDATPGTNLYLTLDARLQRRAAESFPDSLKGAVVAIDPRNGEILVMFSNPSIDPNIFSMAGSVRSKSWGAIVSDTALPLNNRAIAGTYSPGSTFKVVSALAGLETGECAAASLMPGFCNGMFHFGSRIAHCWQERGHGRLDLISAIQQSCNVYFYQLGLRIGDVRINKYAAMLGLGAAAGIDLPGEKDGWLSGEEEYNKRYKYKGWVWTKGLVLDLAIGQAQVVTPIQLALMIGGLGNTTAIYRPFFVKEERNRDGIVVRQHTPRLLDSLSFKSATVAALHLAMRRVIEPGGTGVRASVPGVPVGGKTGSAQNPQGEKTHALFVACAPLDHPVIAIAVVVENAGHGGSIAAPIAGDVLRCFFAETDEGKALAEKYKAESGTRTASLPAREGRTTNVLAPVDEE